MRKIYVYCVRFIFYFVTFISQLHISYFYQNDAIILNRRLVLEPRSISSKYKPDIKYSLTRPSAIFFHIMALGE